MGVPGGQIARERKLQCPDPNKKGKKVVDLLISPFGPEIPRQWCVAEPGSRVIRGKVPKGLGFDTKKGWARPTKGNFPTKRRETTEEKALHPYRCGEMAFGNQSRTAEEKCVNCGKKFR